MRTLALLWWRLNQKAFSFGGAVAIAFGVGSVITGIFKLCFKLFRSVMKRLIDPVVDFLKRLRSRLCTRIFKIRRRVARCWRYRMRSFSRP